MRVAPSTLSIASVTILASLTGCPGGMMQPDTGSGDANPPSDAVADNVTPMDSTPPTDTPSPMDTTPPPTDTPTPPPDGSPPGDGGMCSISGEVATHVTAMQTMGWAALSRSRSLMMYGCAGATNARDCLASAPLASAADIGDNRSAIPTAHLRVLYNSTGPSNYWTRSSVDGRFVARGTHVHDLVRGAEVQANGAMYDPAFFPDNSGFMYQPGGRICPLSVLTTATGTSISVTTTPCVGSSVGLYEHLGAGLAGGDFWATSAGTAAWDDGGHTATLQETRRNEVWGTSAATTLSLMANSGAGFMYMGQRSVPTPFQGDAVLSPSGTAMITRFVDSSGVYQGYVLHLVDASHTGAAITVSTHEVARYCTVGAKPGWSLDERYVVYHHYLGGGPAADADARDLGFTGASDAGFQMYRTQGAANIYLLDLQTGMRTRITNMGPGQYALYPHFRADGWIYFIVRTLGTGVEHIVASDAALP